PTIDTPSLHDALPILSADCPAATRADVKAVAIGDGVVMAPDRYGTGTNALWRSPPDAIHVSFGGNSRRSHTALAHVHHVPFAVQDRKSTRLNSSHLGN